MTDQAKAVEKTWYARVKGILKGELKCRGVTYAQLAEKMAAVGVTDNERNICYKLARGSFAAVFFVMCLSAIGVSEIKIV